MESRREDRRPTTCPFDRLITRAFCFGTRPSPLDNINLSPQSTLSSLLSHLCNSMDASKQPVTAIAGRLRQMRLHHARSEICPMSSSQPPQLLGRPAGSIHQDGDSPFDALYMCRVWGIQPLQRDILHVCFPFLQVSNTNNSKFLFRSPDPSLAEMPELRSSKAAFRWTKNPIVLYQ